MKRQAVLTFVFSHIQCYLVLLSAPFSASESVEIGKLFKEPVNVADRLGAFRLSGNSNGRPMFRASSVDRPQFKYPSRLENSHYFPGRTAHPEVLADKNLAAGDSPTDQNSKGSLLQQRPARSNSLVDRMPMSFGKRATGVQNNLPLPGIKRACRMHDQLGRCLDLMLTHFGGPPGSSPYLLHGEIGYPRSPGRAGFLRDVRGRLARMPLTFGKRAAEVDDGVEHSLHGSLRNHDDDTFTVTGRDMLDRMPNYYGKRMASLSPISSHGLAVLKNLNSGVKNAFRPLEDSAEEGIEETNGGGEARQEMLESKRGSRMDRMPLTYGKRSDTSNTWRYLSHLFPELGLPRLFLPARTNPYDTTGRQITEGQGHRGFVQKPQASMKDREITKQLETPLPKVLDAPRPHKTGIAVALGKQQEQIRPGPTVFPLTRIRTNGLKRAKAGVVYVDLPFLMHQLREQKSKMAPEEYSRLEANAQSVLKRYLLVDTPLPRSARSRLGRMPLTFGKRSRMDRMPLSFGKRSDTRDHLTPLDRDRLKAPPSYSKDTPADPTGVFGPFHGEWSPDDIAAAAGEQQQHNESDAEEARLPTSSLVDNNGTVDVADDPFVEPEASLQSHDGFVNLR